MEEGVEGPDGPEAAEGGDALEGALCFGRHAGSAVKGDDTAEEGFLGHKAGLQTHLTEDILHLREHAALAKLADDKVVGSSAAAERLRGRRDRVAEELEGEMRIRLAPNKGGEAERRHLGGLLHRMELVAGAPEPKQQQRLNPQPFNAVYTNLRNNVLTN